MKISVNRRRCTGCGECKEVCPKGGKIWTIDRRLKKAIPAHLEFCHQCTICAGKCPEDAIRIIRDDN